MLSVTGIEDIDQKLAFLVAVWLPPRTGSCGVLKKESGKEFNNPLCKSRRLNSDPGLELKGLEALQDPVIQEDNGDGLSRRQPC